MLYYGFYTRHPYSWSGASISSSSGWATSFTSYAVDTNATNGVFTMGMNTVLDTSTTAFTTSASMLFNNIYTSAVSMSGLAGNNLIYGSLIAQQFYGGSGNDTINGGGGADTMNGGAGINMVSFGVVGTGARGGVIDPYGTGVNVNLIAGTYNYATTYGARGACVYAGAKGIVLNFRQVWGGDGVDTIAANNLGDTIWGNQKGDSIIGGSGNDLLVGDGNAAAITDGNDTIHAGVGNNTIFGGLGNDIIAAGNGRNYVYGDYAAVPSALSGLRDGNDSISVGNGANVIYGGGGSDTIAAGDGNNLIYADYAAATSQDGNDTVQAGNGRNTVSGGGGADLIRVGVGNNLLFGDFGAPTTNDGADTIVAGLAGAGNNTIYGGGAGDLISAGNGNNLIFGDFGTQNGTTLTGAQYSGVLNPGDGNDTITVGSGSNTIYGGGGSDSITVVSGNAVSPGGNLIFGDNFYTLGNDISPDAGNANLAGSDTILGGAGADTMFGGGGNDLIDGGSGNDVLVGGTGNNVLYSGSASPFNLLTGTVGDRVYGGGGAPGYSIANHDPLSGNNTIYAGYDFTSSGPVASNIDTGNMLTWGSVVLPDFNPNYDALYVAPYTVAVIGAGATPFGPQQGVNTVLDWSGADSLNLTAVQNAGLIVAQTGAGDDTINAGAGNYDIYGGAGLNIVNLQSDTTAHVYIDTLNSRELVNGFTVDDKLYVNTQLVDAFGPYRQTLGVTTVDAINGTNVSGQGYSGGLTGALTFGAVFNSYLGMAPQLILAGSYPFQAAIPGTNNAQPYPAFSIAPGGQNVSTPAPGNYTTWTYGGAFPNNVYNYAAGAGQVADYASGSAELYLGQGFLFNPFTFPIGAALITLGGLTINDAVNNIRPYLNPTYTTGESLTSSYADIITGAAGYGANQQWDNASFLNLFNAAYGGFTPALEITSADLSSNVTNTNGLHAIMAVNTKTADGLHDKTYVFLVVSPDNLITNTKAKLLAEVDYKVTASQIVMYNGAADPYNPLGAQTPILPPAVTSVLLDGGPGSLGNAIAGGYVTTGAAPNLTVHFATTLANAQTVQLYAGTQLVATLSLGVNYAATDTTVTFSSIAGFVASGGSYSVVATSSQGFTQQWAGSLIYDPNNPPLAGSLTETTEYATNGQPVASLLTVTSNVSGAAGFSTMPLLPDVTFSQTAPYSGYLVNFAAYAGAGSTGVFVQDSLGLRQPITSFVGNHGTVANPTILIGASSAAAATLTGSPSDVAIYGFGLYDSITAGTNTDFVIAHDTTAATASVSVGTGLSLGSADQLLINGVAYQIASYDAATGVARVEALVSGSTGNAALAAASIQLKTLLDPVAQTYTTTTLPTQDITFSGGVSGSDTITAVTSNQILYGGGGTDHLIAASGGGDTLVAGAGGQILQSNGSGNHLFDSAVGQDTLIAYGPDTIDASHGNDTIVFPQFTAFSSANPPLITGFAATDVLDIQPALQAASISAAQSFVGDLTSSMTAGGATLGADSYGYSFDGTNTYLLFNATSAPISGITTQNYASQGLSLVVELQGQHTLSPANFLA